MLTRRILIVDDVEDSATSLAFLLEDVGHEVKFTTDPAKALEISRAFQPEFVLLDIGMPQLNGWDLAAQLKADASTAYARIFAITGYSRAKDRRRSEALGIDAHLVKPLAFSEILDLLNSHTSASILKRLA